MSNSNDLPIAAKGDAVVIGNLRDRLRILESVPSPPKPLGPPKIANFIGRDQELAYFAEQLRVNHLAVVTGMAGTGKTALAATLAIQVTDDPQKVFWHTFRKGEGIDVIIWGLAGFLAWHERSDLWQLLERTRQTGGQPPPTETLFAYLFQLLHGSNYLLCFDDFHFVDDDPVLNTFVDQLQKVLTTGDLFLIITTRQIPTFVLSGESKPLDGLTLTDTQRLLTKWGAKLTDSQISELYTRTSGNPEFLILAIDALRRDKDPENIITHLPEIDDIERYLLSEVDETLTSEERNVMMAVAALLGYPGTRGVIEAMLEMDHVWRILRRLSQSHLLITYEGQSGREYSQHALVQTFYYYFNSPQQRYQLHHRAAIYYDSIEPNMFRSALHYQHAGEYELAVRQATLDVNQQLSVGRANMLLKLLDDFAPGQISAKSWAQVALAKGDIYSFLRQVQSSQSAYQAALDELSKLPVSSNVRILKVRICRGLGVLLKASLPYEALNWLQKSLELLDSSDQYYEADLNIQIGTVLMRLGKFIEAHSALERGLQLVPPTAHRLHLVAIENLGLYYYYQNELLQSKKHMIYALQLAEQLNDPFNSLSIRVNMANLKYIIGDWTEATDDYVQAATLAETLGNVQELANVYLNSGVLYLQKGEYEQALSSLSAALELARKAEIHDLLVTCLISLAELYVNEGQPDAARIVLAEAKLLVLTHQLEYLLPLLCYMQSQYYLAISDYPQAGRWAVQTLETARVMKMDNEEGLGLRTLGQFQLAMDQPYQAVTSFAQSIDLHAMNPYEAARTRVMWAQSLSSIGDRDQGKSLLQEAVLVFQRLGANPCLKLAIEAIEFLN